MSLLSSQTPIYDDLVNKMAHVRRDERNQILLMLRAIKNPGKQIQAAIAELEKRNK